MKRTTIGEKWSTPRSPNSNVETESETRLLNSRRTAVRFHGQLLPGSLKSDWSSEMGLSIVTQLASLI